MPHSRLITSQRPRRRFIRFIRAAWRDTSALWREFQVPVLIFVVVSVAGGFVYGELYEFAHQEEIAADEMAGIALIDRPYIMMQLMILESPHEAPPQWYLVIFWYALPPVLVFIVGLGAADFVHLFFNRSDRRDAWRVALVSTYRHHIIVFGAGHVGMRVVNELIEMGREVVVIDNSPDAGVEEVLQRLHVPLINEDARVTSALEKSGIEYADAFVACTGNDHVNLEVIMKVRDMNDNIRIVARMWDDKYARHMQHFMGVHKVLSSSDLSAPAFAASALGIEITQTLSLNGNEYSLLRLTVEPGSFMEGRTIGQLQTENNMDIVLHGVGHSVEVQPRRDVVVKAGEDLVIFAQHSQILSVVARNKSRKSR